MKIKILLFFSFLFCFTIQAGLCNAQNIPDLGAVININDPELEANNEEINDIANFPEVNNAELPESDTPELPEANMPELPESNNIETPEDKIPELPETNNKEVLENNSDDLLETKAESSPEKETSSNNIKSLKDLDKSSSQTSSNNNQVIKNAISNNPKSNTSIATSTDNNVQSSILSNTTTTTKKQKNNRVFTSLMFSEENIREIFKALPASTIGIPDQYIGANLDMTPTINGVTTDNAENNTTSFFIYLNSIMYISKDAWSVWINNNKITNLTNNNNDINVIEISPLYVTIAWKITPLQWESINANNKFSDDKYKIYDNYVELFIKLSPNQTYLPGKNQIIEGMPDINISAQNASDDVQNTNISNEETEDLFF